MTQLSTMTIEDTPRFENEEQELRWLLHELYEDHKRRTAPIMERLAQIEAQKPLIPMKTFLIDYEQFNKQALQMLLDKFKRDWGRS